MSSLVSHKTKQLTSAKVILTSYYKKDIEVAIRTLKNIIDKYPEFQSGTPSIQKIKASEEIHGCRVTELNRKAFTVKGPAQDLPKLSKVKIPESVYFKLLYKDWEKYVQMTNSKVITKKN